jgi:hypothetical protein
MKKITKLSFLITLLFLSATNISFAQVSFGPRIGLNLPVVVGVNTNAQFKPGLHLGGYARIGGEKVAFQPELLFSMKGYKFKNDFYKESLALNYIDIPLMFTAGKTFKWLFGVQPSILLSAKYKTEFGTAAATTTDYKEFMKTVDVGIITGLEYALESGLNFGFRFTYGVPTIFENDAFVKLHNLNLQFTVGYTIGQ